MANQPADAVLCGVCHFYACLDPLWPQMAELLGDDADRRLRTAHQSALSAIKDDPDDDPVKMAGLMVNRLGSELARRAERDENLGILLSELESEVASSIDVHPIEEIAKRAAIRSEQHYTTSVGPDWSVPVKYKVRPVPASSALPGGMPWHMKTNRYAPDLALVDVMLVLDELSVHSFAGIGLGLFHEFISHVHSGISSRERGESLDTRLLPFHDGLLIATEMFLFKNQIPRLSQLECAYLYNEPIIRLQHSGDYRVLRPFYAMHRLLEAEPHMPNSMVLADAALRVASLDCDCLIPQCGDVHISFARSIVGFDSMLDSLPLHKQPSALSHLSDVLLKCNSGRDIVAVCEEMVIVS